MRRAPLTHIFLLCALVALAGLGAACGGDSPTAPSNPIPNVAGTYTGALDFFVDGVRTSTIQARMTVVQSGSQLTITGSVTVSGQTVQLPAFTGNVNETGFFTSSGGAIAESVDDATCGRITATSWSLTFSGSTARYVENATTEFCGNWLVSGTVTR